LAIGAGLLLLAITVLARSRQIDAHAAEGKFLSTKAVASKLQRTSQKPLALADNASHYVGAGGCAAAACHGEPVTDLPSWKNAYSIWATKDPHSRAYTVLRSERGKQMLWLLDGGKASEGAPADKPWLTAAPHRDGRCLSCHSIAPDAYNFPHENLLADGVGCESCHGPADGWRTEHTTARWLARPGERYQEFGACASTPKPDQSRMWNTKDIASRANICVRCHVGGPDRDVNHDLLAAGHPRLNFEYAAFMANLPKHWDDKLDRQARELDPNSQAPKAGDYEARLWAVGQVASALAAAELLGQRAEYHQQGSKSETREEIPHGRIWTVGPITPAWPELSEYDCFACHHDIKSSSWRRKLVYSNDSADDALRRKRPPGALPWGTWYFSLVSERLISKDGLGAVEFADASGGVRKVMETHAADAERVSSPATELATGLKCVAERLSDQPISLAAINRSLHELKRLPPADSWDEAAQRYLALVALINSHSHMATDADRLDYEQINDTLKAIRKDLQFNTDFRSPSHFDVDRMEALRQKFSELARLFTP
jgi:hypothetical protein